MESLVIWYQNSLGSFMPKEVFIFLVSMLPLIELRGRTDHCIFAEGAVGAGKHYLYHWKYYSDSIHFVVY